MVKVLVAGPARLVVGVMLLAGLIFFPLYFLIQALLLPVAAWKFLESHLWVFIPVTMLLLAIIAQRAGERWRGWDKRDMSDFWVFGPVLILGVVVLLQNVPLLFPAFDLALNRENLKRADAVVVSAQVERNWLANSPSYRVLLSVEYEAGGRRRRADNAVALTSYSSWRSAMEKARSYAVGETIQIYYSPRSAAHFVSDPRKGMWGHVVFRALLALMGGAFAGWSCYSIYVALVPLFTDVRTLVRG